ncbi:MAG: type IV pilus inner membrane component PilO [Thermoleophilia bacterium]
MKKRDIGILIGLGAVVLLVAWYFLIIGPKRDGISDSRAELQTEKTKYEDNTNKLKRLDEERTVAKQTAGELMTLNKMVPAGEEVPSLIVELQQSANEAGIKFMRVEPGLAFAAGANTVVPFEMKFQGNFFDVNDFLYRVENYARMQGTNDTNVSGRLLSVISVTLEEPSLDPKFPQVLATLGVNAFMTGAPPVSAKTAAPKSSSSDKTAGP